MQDDLKRAQQAFVSELLKTVDGLSRTGAEQKIASACSDVWNLLENRVRFFSAKGRDEPQGL